jgi:predicted metal-binding membrane protein
MDSAAPYRQPGRSPLEQGGVALLVALAVLTLGAWALTVHQAQTMNMPMGIVLRGAAPSHAEPSGADPMAGMDMGSATGSPMDSAISAGMSGMPMGASTGSTMESAVSAGMSGMRMKTWSWDSFSTFLIAWAVMMAAMMFPAVAPLLLLYRSMAGGARGPAPVWLLASGYLLVWAAAGAITWALVQAGIEIGTRLGAGERETIAPLALGTTLIVAGVYQLTPLKRTCLRQCQSPVGFLMSHWHSGMAGALRMGFAHGLYCLGCCWALFAVLVAAGVMSLAWMLLLTLIVFAEKVLRPAAWSQLLIGAVFVGLGVLVAAGSVAMPWRA